MIGDDGTLILPLCETVQVRRVRAEQRFEGVRRQAAELPDRVNADAVQFLFGLLADPP